MRIVYGFYFYIAILFVLYICTYSIHSFIYVYTKYFITEFSDCRHLYRRRRLVLHKTFTSSISFSSRYLYLARIMLSIHIYFLVHILSLLSQFSLSSSKFFLSLFRLSCSLFILVWFIHMIFFEHWNSETFY